MPKKAVREALMHLPPKEVRKVRSLLLAFYDAKKRDLPWRKTSDPYKILVSEIMLQQTQVATVIPRWHAFLEQFPDVKALAAVREEDVCEAWAGLGYYRRARNLHKAANQVVELHGSKFPESFDDILALAGVGRYTAGAISSIAFGQENPVVDGNVVRVLARYFSIALPKDDARLHRAAWSLMDDLVRGERPGDLNQSVMELGATVCTPALPSCLECPISKGCSAHGEQMPTAYPTPKKPKPREVLHVAFGIFENEEGVAMLQRPLDGLWAGLWEPLSAIGEGSDEAKASLISKHFESAKLTYFCEIRHILTHREVRARIYEVSGKLKHDPKFIFTESPEALGLSKLASKVLDAWSKPTQRELL